MRLHISKGRLIDPSIKLDETADVYIENGLIKAIGSAPPGFVPDTTINAENKWVFPGLIDLCARCNEPGPPHRGSIKSETRAAAAAGVTHLCCEPDTSPVLDTPAVAQLIEHSAHETGSAHIIPLGALTHQLQGLDLSEMAALKKAGCKGLSNASSAISDSNLMRRAMQYAASNDLTVFLRPMDPWLAEGGCMHDGPVSTRLGLTGIPEAAETAGLARDLALVADTGVRAHFCRLSSGKSIQMIRQAQSEQLAVSADVAIHQLFFCETDLINFNSLYHVQPPFRATSDRDALRQAVADGTISAICSDHRPLDAQTKCAPFPSTEPGISGIETLLSLCMRLIDEQLIDLPRLFNLLIDSPAQLLGIDKGHLKVGDTANLVIFNPNKVWQLHSETLLSRGKNSPFLGWEFKGKVDYTLLNGRIVFEGSDEDS